MLGRTVAVTAAFSGLAAATVLVPLVTSVEPAAAGGPSPSSWSIVSARPPGAPAGADALGPARGLQTIEGEVALRPRNPAALSAYADAVSSPSSPLYGRYLGAGQFAARFGPTVAGTGAVENLLRASGMSVTGVSANRLLVSFRSTAAQAESAFRTHLESYRMASGRVAFAPTSPVEMPARVAPFVETVLGLSTVLQPGPVYLQHVATGHAGSAVLATSTTRATSRAKGVGPVACAAAVKGAAPYGGLTQQQVADAYGLGGLYSSGDDGTGETIGVFELEPFSMADLKTFDTCYFGAAKAAKMIARVKVIPVDGGQQIGAGSGEAALDLDDVSALAPGANIEVYEGPNDYSGEPGLIDTFNAMVQDDTAKIITSSWDSAPCEEVLQADDPGLGPLENTIFEQAAAQGQTVLEAAGDAGSDACADVPGVTSPVPPVLSLDPESDQPYVVGVGGTTMTDASTPPAEHVWNDGASPAGAGGAGGGGISAIWRAPSWQASGLVPGFDNASVVAAAEKLAGDDFCGAAVCRETPDVSAVADGFTGVTVYVRQFGGWFTEGGTSSSAPLWAGILADIGATPACASGGGIGFVAPKLYAIATSPSEYKASFNDITAGNNDMFGDAHGLFPATAGYDMASGLGTPKVTGRGGGKGLAYYLCTRAAAIVPAVRGVSPGAVPESGGAVTISGSGFDKGSRPDVAAVQVGSVTLPAADYSVRGPGTVSADLPPSAIQVGTGSTTDGTGSYDVMVTLDNGQTSVPTLRSRLTYYATSSSATQLPQVDGLGPTGGNQAGGTTVTVYGSGFSAGAKTANVTFGSVSAARVTVLSDSELKVTVPPYSPSKTHCATHLNPATNICQVQVQVTTTNGSSAESAIKPEFSGPAAGIGTTGTGEVQPAATEFDYLPTPKIRSVSVATGLASEAGGSLATITGTGLGILGDEWYNVGSYRDYDSAAYGFQYFSATKIIVALPGEGPTTSELAEPITVQTLGSLNGADIAKSPPSNAGTVTYAPTPVVTSIEVLTKATKRAYPAGPATGGTELVIKGQGLGQSTAVAFTDVGDGDHGLAKVYGWSNTITFSLSKVTSTTVTLPTPDDNPGVDQVSACDISGCSQPAASNDIFTYYPAGNPQVTSVAPASGPAGTKVTISGANLGFVEAVYFGTEKATKFANAVAILDCGNTTKVFATAPKGKLGSRVEVRLVTLESEVTGFGKSPPNPNATFTFK